MNVLLVDDNSELRRIYEESLKGQGFEVFQVDIGLLERTLRDIKFGAVVCDTEMRVKGYEACKRALDKGLLDGVVLIGMSNCLYDAKKWDELNAVFYDKRGVFEIGNIVKYSLFKAGKFK